MMGRMQTFAIGYALMLLAGAPVPSVAEGQPAGFVFQNALEEAGLVPHLTGIRGHGAGWGDVDGDGWIDLYVATFHTQGSKPNRLLRNIKGGFRLDDQEALRISTRATGVVFADLDNDGDLDLYVGSMPADEESRLARSTGHPLSGCSLFRNEGEGQFANASQGNGACPQAFGGRSATVLDYDGDGLLDLLVGEDPLPGYNGSSTKSSRLFRNVGDLQFEDVSRDAGIPEGIPGLGVAAADVNNDGWPDFFLASSGGGNRLFLNEGGRRFREAPGSRETFAWPTARGDDMVCGVSFGDVNRDGLLDVVLGQHFERPWLHPVANRLYLNRGIEAGVPRFEDVTEQVGLVPIPMKSPHVEIQDFDNDGWPDIATSVVAFAEERPHPLIFRNLGVAEELPRFAAGALSVNDFPTAQDQAIRRSGRFFDRMLSERKMFYTAPGPSGDYDNDGRLDMFFPSWWTKAPSLLLRNVTPGGNWLDVRVEGSGSVNQMGIGSRVNVYTAGRLGEKSALLGCREVSVGYGYASGQPAIAHFGLGDARRADIELVLPHGQGTIVRRNIKTNQRMTVAMASPPSGAARSAASVDKRQSRRDRPAPPREIQFPPRLTGGQDVVTDTSPEFLKPPATLRPGVTIARSPPTVDFLYYPGQTYEGRPWSNWGDGTVANGKYYSAIGDHLAIGAKLSGDHGTGTALVFEYDPKTKTLRELVDVANLLDMPAGHYTPGKIHTRLDMGRDGWLYFATHRGSSRATTDQYHYKGDWILRTHPQSGRSEVVVHGPVRRHAIPNGLLDPDRLIFYGGTTPGSGVDDEGIRFFAYDVQNRKLLYAGPDGPARYMIFACSTGRVYYVSGKGDGPLMRFAPVDAKPTEVKGSHIGVRSATQETPDGFVYTISLGQKAEDTAIWSFNTRTEETRQIGTAAIGTQAYVASIDVDPTGRYLYYVPGAHGGSDRDGSPVVQFNVRTGKKKVIAFLEPFYSTEHGLTLKGTYSTAIDPEGDKLYITWNLSRGSRAWDTCGLTIVHIPKAER